MDKKRKSGISLPGDDPRRRLVSVSVLLDRPEVREMLRVSNRPLVLAALREALECHRNRLARDEAPPDVADIVKTASELLSGLEGRRLRPVVNATGTILHPDLGRAVLAPAAVDALAGMKQYGNFSLDLDSGRAGNPVGLSERLIRELTGAEAAVIASSHETAMLLMMASLCRGRDVIVSRGQIFESSDLSRLEDCIAQGGATLVGVGTTNKTHLRDYECALSHRPAAVLHVHTGHYRISGFSQHVPLKELAALKDGRDLLLIDDIASGALVDVSGYGLPKQPTVSESLDAGADLVCLSGDQLVGGPRSGIVAGRQDLIGKIQAHPLCRMLRAGKMEELALEKTLRLFLDPEALSQSLPVFRIAAIPAREIRRRAEFIRESLAGVSAGLDISLVEGSSAIFDELMPERQLKTFLVVLQPHGIPAEEFHRRLRLHEPPIVARVDGRRILLDLRTVSEDEDAHIVSAIRCAV